ncbi:MAG: hypothetical protein JXQ76_04785 [Campylobacterales bacterium]|nr:hypothetical protein [Campylobacterales bacterium]
MCIFDIFIVIVVIVLIRYFWWLATQNKENSYIPKGESKNTTPLTSQQAKGQSSDDVAPPLEKPNFLDKPEGEKDDLKKIGGIGPKIEEGLNSIGIFHYNQIAKLTPQNIQWIDEHFAFKGRVERDNWVEQAMHLANGEETEFSKKYKG